MVRPSGCILRVGRRGRESGEDVWTSFFFGLFFWGVDRRELGAWWELRGEVLELASAEMCGCSMQVEVDRGWLLDFGAVVVL